MFSLLNSMILYHCVRLVHSVVEYSFKLRNNVLRIFTICLGPFPKCPKQHQLQIYGLLVIIFFTIQVMILAAGILHMQDARLQTTVHRLQQ